MSSKLITAGAALVALSVTTVAATAADMPYRTTTPYYKGPRSVVAYYNWTGLYAGINFGYGWGSSTWDVGGTSAVAKPKGGLAGGTIGYNYQVGSWVFGIEGDFDWSGVKGSVDCVPGVIACETKNTWLGTARGRIGYAFDRFLPYFTGGAAFGDVKATATGPLTASKTEIGWTVGAGLEYAFLGNWTAKIEYLYVDLGKFDTGFLAPAATATVSFKENIVRAGLNYKFSGPIFSRY